MEERPRRTPRPRIERVYAESCLRTAGDDMPAHHWHPYYEMFYVETGACSYMVENDIYDLHMGDFLLIPPHTFHYTRYRFGPCRRAAVFFRAEDVGQAVRQALPGQGEFLARVQIMQAPEAYQAKVEALLERMVQENGRADRYTAPMLGAMLQELLLACCRVCAILQDVPEQIHTTDREIVRAARFITEHYAEPITAADIAAAAGFSPNYLSRKFREAAGFGVHEYLTFIRLRNAAHELTATGDSITDIALRSGFSNSNYFKDAFKKQYGCTPRDYRRVLEAFGAVLAVNVAMSAVISGLELWQMDLLASLFDSGSAEFHEMIVLVYRYEVLGAVPLAINSAVLALLYGLGKTRLTLLLNIARVFVFRIPVFWFLQNFTNLGEASVGVVMMVSNTSVAVVAVAVATVVIRQFKHSYALA